MQKISELFRFALYRGALLYHEIKHVVDDIDKETKQLENETKMFPVSNSYSG